MRLIQRVTNLDATGHPTNESAGTLTTGESVKYECYPVCSFAVSDDPAVQAFVDAKCRQEAARLMENEFNAAARTIAECPNVGVEALDFIVGVLQHMLAGMAGVSATNPRLNTHSSCVDHESTEAIRRLIAAMIDKA
jgi:hypothetical protein